MIQFQVFQSQTLLGCMLVRGYFMSSNWFLLIFHYQILSKEKYLILCGIDLQTSAKPSWRNLLNQSVTRCHRYKLTNVHMERSRTSRLSYLLKAWVSSCIEVWVQSQSKITLNQMQNYYLFEFLWFYIESTPRLQNCSLSLLSDTLDFSFQSSINDFQMSKEHLTHSILLESDLNY